MAFTQWTEDLLGIPKAIASKYANPSTELWEEMVSIANYCMMRAAKNFDPLKWPSNAPVANYFFSQIYFYMKRLHKAGHVQATGNSEEIFRVISEKDKGMIHLEGDDSSRWLLSVLSPLERYIFKAKAEGVKVRFIARRLGISVDGLYHRMRVARGKLKRRLAAHGRRRGVGNLKPIPPPRTKEQREAARKFCVQMQQARWAMGDVPLHSYYLYSKELRSVWGPFAKLRALAALMGNIPGSTHSMLDRLQRLAVEKGLLLLRGEDARKALKLGAYLYDPQAIGCSIFSNNDSKSYHFDCLNDQALPR